MPENPSSNPLPEVTRQPKVFISYSWSSPGHQFMVRTLAERLLGDGVDVLIDIFDLKEGQDKYSFMEKMVTDPTVTHVLVICDKGYAEKADAKKAGVGTESQMISSEVYAKVDQEKFIPVVCEFADGREPFLPTFLRGRIWIDFSSPEAANQNWEKLIRILHGKPAFQKPKVGKLPAYLNEEAHLASPARGKLAVLRQAFNSNSRGFESYRQDFLDSCIGDADALRVRSDPGISDLEFAEKVRLDCGKLKLTRDTLVDWVLLESAGQSRADFEEALLSLLENLLELKTRPANIKHWSDRWFEAHSVFVYETFLYIVAALLKTGAYAVLHAIFESHYLRPRQDRYGNRDFVNFSAFWGYADSLQLVLAPPNQRLYSPAADLISKQADRTDIPLMSVIEADLLAALMSLLTPEARWIPQTIYYSDHGDFPFFTRAAQHRHFSKLAIISGYANAGTLRTEARKAFDNSGMTRGEGFSMLNRSIWESLNMERLDTLN